MAKHHSSSKKIKRKMPRKWRRNFRSNRSLNKTFVYHISRINHVNIRQLLAHEGDRRTSKLMSHLSSSHWQSLSAVFANAYRITLKICSALNSREMYQRFKDCITIHCANVFMFVLFHTCLLPVMYVSEYPALLDLSGETFN